MHPAIEKSLTSSSVGLLARELAKIEKDRTAWLGATAQMDALSKHVREISQAPAYARLAEEIRLAQLPAVSLVSQIQSMVSEDATAMQSINKWQEVYKAGQESMRKMMMPIESIRQSLMVDDSTQRMLKDFASLGARATEMASVFEKTASLSSAAATWAKRLEESHVQTSKVFESLNLGSTTQRYLKDFESISNQWKVPNEVVSLAAVLQDIQKDLGLRKIALPTIDWNSAAALAKILGKEGVEDQFSWIGIGPDGQIQPNNDPGQKGLLSHRQDDVIKLISFLLIFLIFAYQEYSSSLQEAKTEVNHQQVVAALAVQSQQLQSLTVLIAQCLADSVHVPEERFVVRSRSAPVRSQPRHGSSVEAKLLPNEVVRSVGRDGKWVEVGYYHWLLGEHRTGWVLKKYLERVPANFHDGGGE
ncbi:hypothetical protein KIH07_06535 [Hydrogenophaga taeniospiralis]|uniref:SH3 domain-containing protein n=1 Tax=Hydrogenophaga taeniospiralis TaxID=65656 RepID=UPI001CFC018B|nr:SH3 domain-containing protein [Hydrogenophaga taeniospiralis]MCB4363383.1 hypothetical protein [Hydrogenophaga taeniospiralis]